MSEKNEINLDSLSGDQLQSAVQSILQDPSVGQLLAQMQGKSPSETPAIPAVTPDMMEKLPHMMAALAPLVKGMNESRPDGRDEGEKHDKDDKDDKGGKGSKGASEAEKRKKLLTALRPYLSENRRDAVDNILKVTEMTDLLSGLSRPGSKS